MQKSIKISLTRAIPAFDGSGQRLDARLVDSKGSIDDDLAWKIYLYALKSVTDAGFAVADWRVEVSSADAEEEPFARAYDVRFTNLAGGHIDVAGIILNNEGEPALDHGFDIGRTEVADSDGLASRIVLSPLLREIARRLSVRHDGNALSEEAILTGLHTPVEMPQFVYLDLQALLEGLDLNVARGEDAIDGFDALHEEVHQLMSQAPWTLHPDHGCVLAEDVSRLDALESSRMERQ